MAKRCQENDAEIRKVILDAAEKIGNEQGIDKITARRISDAIGYSTGVIYYHFQNMEEILDLLLQNRNNDIYETVKQRIDSNGTLRDNCCRVMECICGMIVSDRSTHAHLFMEGSFDPSKDSPWTELTRCIIDVAMQKGEVLAEKVEDTICCLGSLFIGYGVQLYDSFATDEYAAKQQGVRILDMLLTGIIAK